MMSYTSRILAVMTALLYVLAYVFMTEWLAWAGNMFFAMFAFSAVNEIIDKWKS